MLSRVAVGQPIDADLNARPACAVPEGIDPVSVDLSHSDAHGHSVAYILHMSSTTRHSLTSGTPYSIVPPYPASARASLAGASGRASPQAPRRMIHSPRASRSIHG